MYCFCKISAFYISLGIDAYILNHILNHILKLKLTDMSNTKRVGIPINSIEKYIVYVNKMIMSSSKCCRLSIVTKILDSSLNSNKLFVKISYVVLRFFFFSVYWVC